eukprot:GHVL01023241.1.p1 GENE.GHVL01023241.1~~GHVL01023241.1.p1  ORF type:complete len:598 (+),score=56.52 GHVL01023241.1:119-1912(+)
MKHSAIITDEPQLWIGLQQIFLKLNYLFFILERYFGRQHLRYVSKCCFYFFMIIIVFMVIPLPLIVLSLCAVVSAYFYILSMSRSLQEVGLQAIVPRYMKQYLTETSLLNILQWVAHHGQLPFYSIRLFILMSFEISPHELNQLLAGANPRVISALQTRGFVNFLPSCLQEVYYSQNSETRSEYQTHQVEVKERTYLPFNGFAVYNMRLFGKMRPKRLALSDFFILHQYRYVHMINGHNKTNDLILTEDASPLFLVIGLIWRDVMRARDRLKNKIELFFSSKKNSIFPTILTLMAVALAIKSKKINKNNIAVGYLTATTVLCTTLLALRKRLRVRRKSVFSGLTDTDTTCQPSVSSSLGTAELIESIESFPVFRKNSIQNFIDGLGRELASPAVFRAYEVLHPFCSCQFWQPTESCSGLMSILHMAGLGWVKRRAFIVAMTAARLSFSVVPTKSVDSSINSCYVDGWDVTMTASAAVLKSKKALNLSFGSIAVNENLGGIGLWNTFSFIQLPSETIETFPEGLENYCPKHAGPTDCGRLLTVRNKEEILIIESREIEFSLMKYSVLAYSCTHTLPAEVVEINAPLHEAKFELKAHCC